MSDTKITKSARADELTDLIRSHQDDVWDALLEIHEDKLYRDMGYKTMEIWAKEEFGWTRDYIGKQIRAARSHKLLSSKMNTNVSILPTTEGQMRPIATLDPEQQIEVWNLAVEKAEGVPTEKQVRAAKSQIVLHEPVVPPPLPPDKFQLIYADPPWRYDFSPTSGRKVERHYPTMDIETIKALPIAEAAYDNCVLFLWGTSPKLPWALEVMTAWGFEYKTCMVWIKDKIGMGYYARQQHELLLIGGKGKSQLPDPSNRPSSVITAPRGEHSVKPKIVYEIIEQMYPALAKLELFARKTRVGWDSWGDEV